MKTLVLLTFLIACGPQTTPPIEPPPPGDDDPVAAAPDAAPRAEEPPPLPPDAEPAPAPEAVKQALRDAELAAYQAMKPTLDTACARCHTQGGKKANKGKLKHFDMTSYPFGGHHTETITTTLRHVVGLDGSKPKMPQDDKGSLTEDQLAVIQAWAVAYDAAEAGGAHEVKP